MSKTPKVVFCPNCRNRIYDTARICPFCGAKLKKSFGKKLGCGIVVFLLLLIMIGLFGSRGSQHKRSQSESFEESLTLAAGSANALSTVGSHFPTDEPKMNPTETFVPTETQLPVPSEAVSVSDSTSGIDPAFKAAMDSYEAFFDEYVAFMKKYNEPGNAVSMLADYASMMGKYSTMSAEMEAMNSSDLNAEELAYYLEVTHRINQKLLTVAF